jgi:hypothetical protein
MDAAIRCSWRQQVVNTERWERHSDAARPVRGGEAGGFLVRSVQTGLIGYLKPLNPRGHHSRSAYEKIASDLAYEIGVNVPPVVLYRRPDAESSQPREVSISFAWAGAVPWGDLCSIGETDGGVRPPALAALIRRLVAGSSGVMALDAWLRNTDRNNEGNAIMTYAGVEDPGQLFYVDFANAMDFDGHWSADKDNHQKFERVAVPPLLATCAARNRVEDAAQRIAGLSDSVVAEIVGRVPDDFLRAPAREQLLGWLVWRKQRLVPAWAQWYAGN